MEISLRGEPAVFTSFSASTAKSPIHPRVPKPQILPPFLAKRCTEQSSQMAWMALMAFVWRSVTLSISNAESHNHRGQDLVSKIVCIVRELQHDSHHVFFDPTGGCSSPSRSFVAFVRMVHSAIVADGQARGSRYTHHVSYQRSQRSIAASCRAETW
jgi:hypothetical protein